MRPSLSGSLTRFGHLEAAIAFDLPYPAGKFIAGERDETGDELIGRLS